jgi:hypothetical protein
MPKITALSNIKHDGKDYVAGDTLDVNKSDAEYLVKLGAAEAGGKAAKKAAEPEATETVAPESAPAAAGVVDAAAGSDATTA